MEKAEYRYAYMSDDETLGIQTTWCDFTLSITDALKMARDVISTIEEHLEQKKEEK